MPSWRRVFTSEEARIESLAGQSPEKPDWWKAGFNTEAEFLAIPVRDWPMPEPPPYAADDENDEHPETQENAHGNQ